MYKGNYLIENNDKIADKVYRMVLSGDTSCITNPGQFVNIQIPGHFLRRPISICDYNEKKITLIYKILGLGTYDLSRLTSGQYLNLLTGLGNGFDVSAHCELPLLIGGGVGVPPLYGLCIKLIEKNIYPTIVLGFTSQKDSFYVREFAELVGDENVYVSTLDGSMGTKGLVTDAIIKNKLYYDYTFSCGPIPMLKAIYNFPTSGQFSFEERMGCGFGGCMGCTHPTIDGYKRICKEGPVLKKEEIIWQ